MGDVRGVLLDLDGTLLDHRGRRIVRPSSGPRASVLRSRVTPLDIGASLRHGSSRCLSVVGAPFRSSVGSGSAGSPENLPSSATLRPTRCSRVPRPVPGELARLPGAAELIDQALAACRVGVLTNGDEAQQRDKLGAIGLRRPGLRMFASSTLGHAKPAVRAFELACAGLGTSSVATVMVGDE